MSDFTDWIKEELTLRGWTQNDLARRANISSGGLSLIMTEQRGITASVCRSISRALKLPEEEVFRRAGLLSDKKTPIVADEREKLSVKIMLDLLKHLSQLDEREQQDVLAYVLRSQQHTDARVPQVRGKSRDTAPTHKTLAATSDSE